MAPDEGNFGGGLPIEKRGTSLAMDERVLALCELSNDMLPSINPLNSCRSMWTSPLKAGGRSSDPA